jgi:hypothetical protein
MKKKPLRPLLVCVISSLVLAGCFEVTTVVKVNSDGSGTIVESMLLGEGLATMIKMAELQKSEVNDKGQFQPSPELFNKDSLRLQASKIGKGVRLLDAVAITRERREGYRATYEFDNVETIRISQTPAPGGAAMGDLGSSDGGQEIFFSFIKGATKTLLIKMPEPSLSKKGTLAPDDTTGTQSTENLAAMQMLLKGLRFHVSVEVEGTIAETNASFVEANRVTLMEVDFDKLLADPVQLQKLQTASPRTSEETRMLLSTIPGMKVETNRVTRVVF